MKLPAKRWAWIAANLAGIPLYLWLASSLWVKPGTEGQPGGPGDAFYWLLILIPFNAVIAVLDLVALYFIFFRKRAISDKVFLLLVWFVLVTLWFAANIYDNRRTARVISPEYACLTNRSTRTLPLRVTFPTQPTDSSSPTNAPLR